MSMRVRLVEALTGLTAGWLGGYDGSAKVFASATSAGAVTASDATVLDYNALWVADTGTVVVRTANGETVTFTIPTAGVIIPVAGDRVMAATTCLDVVWLKW